MGSPFQAELMLLAPWVLPVTLYHGLFTYCFDYDVCVANKFDRLIDLSVTVLELQQTLKESNPPPRLNVT